MASDLDICALENAKFDYILEPAMVEAFVL